MNVSVCCNAIGILHKRSTRQPTCIHSIDLKWFSIVWDIADTVVQMRYVAYFCIVYTSWNISIVSTRTSQCYSPANGMAMKTVGSVSIEIERGIETVLWLFCCYNTSTYVRSNDDTVQSMFEFTLSTVLILSCMCIGSFLYKWCSCCRCMLHNFEICLRVYF